MYTHVRMYACTHVRMYLCTHVRMYRCMHVRMYACTHVPMYACTHVPMYACTHVRMYACSQMDWQRARPKLTKVSSPSKEFPDHRIDILISPRHTESCLALLWLKRFRSSTRPLWANASCKIGLGDWRSYLLDTEHVNGVHLTFPVF